MGIYIKGMEMPKGIEMLVVFSDGTVHKCLPGMREYVEKGTAVPLPPHGRLVEDIAVIEQIDEWLNSVGTVIVGHGLSYYGELLGCIEDAPTIIPAEPA